MSVPPKLAGKKVRQQAMMPAAEVMERHVFTVIFREADVT